MSLRRPRQPSRATSAGNASRLVHLAAGLARSGSRLEDAHWEAQLTQEIDRLLRSRSESVFNAALDDLFERDPRAYDALMDLTESRTESGTVARDSEVKDALLIAAPILGWSRNTVPTGPLRPAVLTALRTYLTEHVVAVDAELALADCLYSPDQLPGGFADTARFSADLFDALAHRHDLNIDFDDMPTTVPLVADVRYLFAAVAAPRGMPLFRWQETGGDRIRSLEAWKLHAGEALRSALPGCAFELLLPDAFFAATRQTDQEAPPYALKAGALYLETTLSIAAADLTAIIAPCYGYELEEFRVSLLRREDNEVLHGTVWPAWGMEDDSTDVVTRITATLREAGIDDIHTLEQRFSLEYCPDCGTPMFADRASELVHAEMPEEAEPEKYRLH